MTALPIFYGAHIRVVDVLAMGEVLEQVGPALLTLYMIEHRREHGSLASSATADTALKRVPREVWGMVRELLTGPALACARRAIVEQLRCPCHRCVRDGLESQQAQLNERMAQFATPEEATAWREAESERWGGAGMRKAAEEERWAQQASQVWRPEWIECAQGANCITRLHGERWAAFATLVTKEHARFRSLLGYYGLAWPLPAILLQERMTYSAFSQPTIPIALAHSSRAIPTHYPRDDDAPLEHLPLPPSAAAPFAHFCRDFTIAPADVQTGALVPVEPRFHFLAWISHGVTNIASSRRW